MTPCLGCLEPLPAGELELWCRRCLDRLHERLAEVLLTAFVSPFAAPVSWATVLRQLQRETRRTGDGA